MRALIKAAAIVAAVVAVIALGLWLARVPLAERVLAWQLARYGYPEARFEVTRVGWHGATVRAIQLRPERGPSAARVTARYRPARLVGGNYRHVDVTVTGLRARYDPATGWRARAATAAADRPARAAPGPGRLLAGLPNLHVRDARIEVASPVGPWRVEADGDLTGGGGGRRARLSARGRNERLRVDAELEAEYDGAAITVMAAVREDDGFVARAEGRASGVPGRAQVELDYSLAMPAAADLPWALLPGPRPAAGAVWARGTAGGVIAGGSVPRNAAALVGRLVAGDWRADARIEARDLALAARFEGLSLDAAARVRSEDGALVARADGDGAMRIERVAEALWSRLEPPSALVPYLAGPHEMTWPDGEVARVGPDPSGDRLTAELRPRLSLRWPRRSGSARLDTRVRAVVAGWDEIVAVDLPAAAVALDGLATPAVTVAHLDAAGEASGLAGSPAGRFELRAELGRVRAAGLGLDGVDIRLPVTVGATATGWRIAAADGGELNAARVLLPAGWTAGAGLNARVTAGRLVTGAAPAAELRLDVAPARIEPPPGRPRLAPIAVDGGTVAAVGNGDGLSVAARGFGARVPRYALRVSGVDAHWRPSRLQGWLAFEVGEMRHTGTPSWLAPVTVTGTVDRRPDGMVLAAEGRAADGRLPFRVRGRAAPDLATGTATVTVPEFEFAPGGLQPRHLAPVLARVERASGRARAELDLAWDRDGPNGTAALALTDLGLRHELVEIDGASGRIRLDELLPPRTAGPQRIELRRVDAGVAIADAAVDFELVAIPGRGTGLRVREAGGRVIEGRVAVRDWTMAPEDQLHALTLDVSGVSLERVLERLSIEGLNGSGRLSGAIPVTVGAQGVAIRDGRLRGTGGHVRFRSERAERALADADRSVALMLRALRDFAYDTIEVGVDRELDGDARVEVHLEGRNPDVLDGHPFDFNISLTGDVEPLLQALARGRALTNALIERNFELDAEP